MSGGMTVGVRIDVEKKLVSPLCVFKIMMKISISVVSIASNK
jgi:hypothetical protein